MAETDHFAAAHVAADHAFRQARLERLVDDTAISVEASLKHERADARVLYEDLYCARGEMENRIKECQLDLFAACPERSRRDRTSTATMRANQLRLWFASIAYVLLEAVRRIGLQATELADATCGSIRLKLLKVGALVRVSVRRVRIAMTSSYPRQRA